MSMRAIKRLVPWRAKVYAKLVLSRVPVRYRFWQGMNLFVHGAMDRPEYALQVMRSHLARLGWRDLCEKSVLELGPGDGLSTAVVARAYGAKQVILVDSGAFARTDPETYIALAQFLRAQGIDAPALDDCVSSEQILQRCNATYLTRGLQDLQHLPDACVDLVFSQAVLEHVRAADLQATLRETRRVLAPDGVCSHQVDLRDHLGGALNNLRFSDRTWEAGWMVSSGFYTNRVRFGEMLGMFAAAGFAYDLTDVQRWSQLPTRRSHLLPRFRDVPEADLTVSQFDILARRA
ncbi:MAG: methyltransferase domain-containing protein [Steroidobacteraceae bacterium]